MIHPSVSNNANFHRIGLMERPEKLLTLKLMVERSFSWLENFRRLTIDYEFLADTAEAMVKLAFTQIMLNRIFQ